VNLLDEGPLAVFNKKIADKTLLPDEHQLKVVGELQKLYERSNDYEPKSASKSWFQFGKSKPIVNEIKGLYIYGSVGGGKTMLMDLFYDCCKVCLALKFIRRRRKFRFHLRLIFRSERRSAFTSIHS
jgi:peroxisome-assembly ATPase